MTFFLALGVIGCVVGTAVWGLGARSYNVCNLTNQLVSGSNPCAQTEGHIGVFILLSGAVLLVLAGVLYFAERTTR